MTGATALSDIRVLDLTDELGIYATKVLADLGAEVIRVDPATGNSVIRSPYMDGMSLAWLFMNQNKKSVTLDLGDPRAGGFLERLWARCDVLVWSSLDGTKDAHWPRVNLMRGDPRKIVTLVTPFGVDGPYAAFKSSDLVNMALGGFLSLSGYPDHPVVPFGEQSFFAVSLHAAMGTLAALYHRLRSGEGQEIEVSAQEAVAHALENAAQYFDLEGTIRSRVGEADLDAGTGIFSCLDGDVFLMAAFQGSLLNWDNLLGWMISEGVVEAARLAEPIWRDPAWRSRAEARKQFRSIFGPFAQGKSKESLYLEGQRRGVNITPVFTPRDIARSPHLHARRFFRNIDIRGRSTRVRGVGLPFRADFQSKAYVSPGFPGVDNTQVYAELGMNAIIPESRG